MEIGLVIIIIIIKTYAARDVLSDCTGSIKSRKLILSVEQACPILATSFRIRKHLLGHVVRMDPLASTDASLTLGKDI